MRICVVDDEAVITRVIENFLTDLGHQVVTWSTGQALLEHLDAGNKGPDLMIVDLNLGDISGAAVIEQAHEVAPLTRFILMSGMAAPTMSDTPARRAVVAFLRKPLRLAELEFAVDQIASLDNSVGHLVHHSQGA